MGSLWMPFAPLVILILLSLSPLVFVQNLADSRTLKSEPTHACADEFRFRYGRFPFCNVTLSLRERVQDLVGRLTLSEKIQLLVSEAAGVPRLGVPPYQWWSEALHGVASSTGVHFMAPIPAATSFPQVILLAASFNATLWHEMGKVVSTEARAMYNLGLSGLTFWSPNINIFRDPRWGRGQETPGEDPFLAGKYATHYVKGLQDGDFDEVGVTHFTESSTPSFRDASTMHLGPKKLKVSACCKHFTAYDMEKSGGTDCFHFNAEVTLQDLEDTYNAPFKACVQDGEVSCIMCSYNRLNGVPTCADYNLLTKTVQQEWSFDGYIVSDCDAVALIHDYINYTSTPEDAVSLVLKAGMDLNCGTYVARHAQSAIDEGKLSELNIDKAISKLVSVQMRLGLFDGNPQELPYGMLGPDVVCTEGHQYLALEAARQGIVLLKNEGETLPLFKTTTTLGLVGPHGNASAAMLADYAGIPCKFITPLQGLQAYGSVIFETGCANVSCEKLESVDAVVELVEKVDTIVLVVGLGQDQETEGHDRISLLLPGQQEKLVTIAAAAAAARNHSVILVLMSGGPVDLSFAKNNVNISSILWIGYPGEAGGKALAEVIYGDYNPGGRLPVTWYPEEFVKVDMLDMNMRPDEKRGYPGRTYRFYNGKRVYDFGYGKSFTTFLSSFVSVPEIVYVKRLPSRVVSVQERPVFDEFTSLLSSEFVVEGASCHNNDFDVTVNVSNTGNREGTHVVLLYVKPPANLEGSPIKFLVAFERIHLEAKKFQDVVFKIVPCKDLTQVQAEGERGLYSGVYTMIADDAVHSLKVILDQ